MPLITHNADQSPSPDYGDSIELKDSDCAGFKALEAASLSYEILEDKLQRKLFVDYASKHPDCVRSHLYWKSITLQDMHVDTDFLNELEKEIQATNKKFRIPRPMKVTIIEEDNRYHKFEAETGHVLYAVFSPNYQLTEFALFKPRSKKHHSESKIMLPRQSMTSALLRELAEFINVPSPSWLITKKYSTHDELVAERTDETMAVISEKNQDT